MRARAARSPGFIVMFAATLTGAAFARPAHAAWPIDGAPICTETHTQGTPVICSDGAQGAIIFWPDNRLGSYDIYAQRVDSSGAVMWSVNGVAVCSSTRDQRAPQAVSVNGGAVVFWYDFRSGTNDDIYAQRLDGQGLAQWAFNGIPLGTDTDDDRFPVASPDGGGTLTGTPGWNVIWATNDDSDRMGIFGQHVNATGAALWTPAASGGVPIAPMTSALISPPVMASDGVGSITVLKGAVVAWSQSSQGSATGADIYARRIAAGGTAQWGSPQVVCGLTGNQFNPAIVQVGGSSTIIAWDDNRTGDYDIYAQKLNSSGAPQWIANGLPVCRASTTQNFTHISGDQAGGAFVTWQDLRSGVQKVYAQHLDPNGQPLWALDGIPLCSAAGAQQSPVIISDAALGAIIAWQDHRGGSTDLYAQRINANGTLLWPSDGMRLSAAGGDQVGVSLISDLQNGALAAWLDSRAGNSDVYANRAFAATPVDAPLDAPQKLRLAFVSSNPSRSDVRLRLELPEAATVTADVLDAQGRRVRMLQSGTNFGAGTHLLTWDGADASGAPSPAGVFFVRVRAGAETLTTRVVALR